MLIFRLFGGLGNQMFQYAFGRYLSIKYNTDLILDTSFFDSKMSNRKIGIIHFNLNLKIDDTCSKKFKHFNNATLNKYFNYIIFNFNVFSESKVSNFKDVLLNKKKGYFDGYWQSEKYFYEIRNLLIEEFTPKFISLDTLNLINKIKLTTSISLHIRKGDYLNNINSKIYSNCSQNYYMNSIYFMLNKFPDAIFYIFTDDIIWVKQNLNFTEIRHEFVSKEPIEDLYIMSNCQHNIVSNSTFSWWSAWLNINSHKVVIAPLYWFTKESNITHEVIPFNWIRIANN